MTTTKEESAKREQFYVRYYVGHKGKVYDDIFAFDMIDSQFGHEFLEFEFRPDGKLRYANNSNYKNDTLIRKECYVSKSVMEELKRIIDDSEIMNVCSGGTWITSLTQLCRKMMPTGQSPTGWADRS